MPEESSPTKQPTMVDLRNRIERCLLPNRLEIEDQSRLHAGHGAAGGHFVVTVVSERFIELSAVERHRLIYDAVGDLIPEAIHSLSIKALSPEESI